MKFGIFSIKAQIKFTTMDSFLNDVDFYGGWGFWIKMFKIEWNETFRLKIPISLKKSNEFDEKWPVSNWSCEKSISSAISHAYQNLYDEQ